MYVYDEQTGKIIPLRETCQYRKKKRIVRDGWIIAALVMTMLPPTGVIVLALFSTFMSFTVLDESVYNFEKSER